MCVLGGIVTEGHSSEGIVRVKDSKLSLEIVSGISVFGKVIQTLGQVRNEKIEASEIY